MRWWKRAEVSEDVEEEEDPLAGLSHTDAEQFAAARLDAVEAAGALLDGPTVGMKARKRKPRRHQNTTSVRWKPMHCSTKGRLNRASIIPS